jgi:signal recognition particle subunit SRP54
VFDHLTERLSRAIKTLRGEARLTESNIQEALREVRVALLEADVALPVVRTFIERVREKALGEEVIGSLAPGQAAVGVVYRELVALMGDKNDALDLATRPPAVILLAGLQGSGKTTTAGKLARWLKTGLRKKVLLASCDVYRPAAIEQLKTLAAQVDAEFFPSAVGEKPVDIASRALDHARTHYADVLIVDSAGRLAIDEAMMREITELHAVLEPVETLFVVDAMQGQDAVNTARAFADALPLTGVVLTKLDGDARGGAALSVREITGKPIKFVGVGEKLDALEPFHPDRMASRILGMGDVLSLLEDMRKTVDIAEAEKLAQKVSGQDFARGLQAAGGSDEEDGRARRARGQAPRQSRAARPGRTGHGRENDPPHRGHHQCHDARGARKARGHQGLAQAPHRGRRRRDRSGGEPPAQPVRADAEDDEDDGEGRDGEDDAEHEGHVPRNSLTAASEFLTDLDSGVIIKEIDGKSISLLLGGSQGPQERYFRLKPFSRMKAPKSARSGTEYWRALSSDQP